MRILTMILVIFNVIFSCEEIDKNHLGIIEQFLSSMNTLEAEMTMDIGGNVNSQDRYDGKIWLDRKNKLLRINYGKSCMIAKNGTLTVYQENECAQEFFTEDTPAGLLLRPSINFNRNGVAVKNLSQKGDLWILNLVYDSPAGSVPVTMYFKPKPIMLLMGWTIQNPNGSITNVYLNPNKIHMAITIPPAVFQIKSK